MAGVPVFIKFTNANPYTIGIVRLAMATLLTLLLIIFKKESIRIDRKGFFQLILIGIIFSIHWITYFFSIKIASATIGILGASTYGVHLILLGWIFLGIRPTWVDWIAIIMAITGTMVILPAFTLSNQITLGLVIAIISGLFFAMLPIFHQRNRHMTGNQRALGQYFFAIPLFLLFAGQFDFQLADSDWYSLIYLGVIGTFLAHTFWINVTTKLPTTVSSLIFYIIIPITMTISHLWLKEEIGVDKILGAFLIVSANILGIYNRFRKTTRIAIPD